MKTQMTLRQDPPPDIIRYTIILDRDLHRKMKIQAATDQVTIQVWIHEAIREKLKNDKN